MSRTGGVKGEAVRHGLCPGRQRCFAVGLLVAAFLAAALGGCGSTVTDANEPNDEVNAAHVLAPDVPVEGVIGADDSDIFQCDAPAGAASPSFTVTVKTEDPQDIELQVGASIPDAWEGITWPGWKADAKGDRVEAAGKLGEGTVLMFLRGTSGTVYSISIAWK